MISKKLKVIGYACDLAANQKGAAEGPAVLKQSPYLEPLKLPWLEILKVKTQHRQLQAVEEIYRLCHTLSVMTSTCQQEGDRFLVIGGDHSAALGTWSKMSTSLQGPLGLIWIDAHMDAHTPETSLTKNIHGMPLATLLGFGDPKLTRLSPLQPALLPSNVVLIGIRSYESGEANLLKQLNVRIYFMEEVASRGVKTVLEEAIQQVSQSTKGFGLSIDLDAFDPAEAPGVNTPEITGIHAKALLSALSEIHHHPQFIGAEIVEFNPSADKEHKTEQLTASLIRTLFNLPKTPRADHSEQEKEEEEEKEEKGKAREGSS